MTKAHQIKTGADRFICEHCKKESDTQSNLESMACLNEITRQFPFWSDDVDFDLLSIFTVLANMIEPTTHETLWTFGGETYGRLNHPSVWSLRNGPVALFFRNKPTVQPDLNGWFKFPNGMTTNSPLIEATWIEVLRDAWAHGYIVMCDGIQLWDASKMQDVLMAIMWHIRDVSQRPDIQMLRSLALSNVMAANELFKVLLATEMFSKNNSHDRIWR